MPESSNDAPRRKRGRATDIDAVVGKHIRHRRMLLGMSQAELAGTLGITFQQLQKYERGMNRVGAGRLYELSRALHTSVSYFYSGTDNPGDVAAFDEDTAGQMGQRETVDLVRAYYAVKDPIVRRRLLDLIRALGNAGGAAEPDAIEPEAGELEAKAARH